MDAAVTAFPVVQDLTRLLTVMMVVNAVLTGLVILFAYRALLYRERLRDLEEANACSLPPLSTPLSDDRPIPAVRDPRRAVWRPPAGS